VNDVLAYMRTLPEKDGTAQTLIQPLKDDLTLIFSETELDEIIAERHDRITVIFAGLTWCRPCKGMQRPVQKLAEHYKDVTFLKLFGNANARTKYLFKTRLQIRSTPCFIVFRGDKVLYSQTGSNKEKFETNLRSFLRSEELPEAIIYPNTH
jgi:thiol-disulfide isomerase/thioredoxin